MFFLLFYHLCIYLPARCCSSFSQPPFAAHNSCSLPPPPPPHPLLFLFPPSVNSLHCHQSVYLLNTNLSPLPSSDPPPLLSVPFLHRCPSERWDCVSECAGDLERGSIRNLKINSLSARKSMGLIGMPIGPVKTIKREEKCLTTSPLLLT